MAQPASAGCAFSCARTDAHRAERSADSNPMLMYGPPSSPRLTVARAIAYKRAIAASEFRPGERAGCSWTFSDFIGSKPKRPAPECRTPCDGHAQVLAAPGSQRLGIAGFEKHIADST